MTKRANIAEINAGKTHFLLETQTKLRGSASNLLKLPMTNQMSQYHLKCIQINK